jgi:hypothetical protein
MRSVICTHSAEFWPSWVLTNSLSDNAYLHTWLTVNKELSRKFLSLPQSNIPLMPFWILLRASEPVCHVSSQLFTWRSIRESMYGNKNKKVSLFECDVKNVSVTKRPSLDRTLPVPVLSFVLITVSVVYLPMYMFTMTSLTSEFMLHSDNLCHFVIKVPIKNNTSIFRYPISTISNAIWSHDLGGGYHEFPFLSLIFRNN